MYPLDAGVFDAGTDATGFGVLAGVKNPGGGAG
jgi:hypothetical protein